MHLSLCFCIKNALEVTYLHLCFQSFSSAHIIPSGVERRKEEKEWIWENGKGGSEVGS